MGHLKRFNELYDLIKKNNNLWNLFTKKEEYQNKRTDKYGRLSYKSSNNDNILNPLVSGYIVKNGFNTDYEDGKKFAIFLSHDIDDVYTSINHLVRSIIPYPHHKQKLGFIKFIQAFYKKQNPYLNFMV